VSDNRRISVRAYADRDFDDLVARWHETNLVSYRYVEEHQRHTLEGARAFFRSKILPSCAVWVAETMGDLVGLIAIEAPWIRQLTVFPGHQRRGVGTALLGRARECSPAELRLYTFRRNDKARAFYENHGFEVVAFGVSPAPELEPDVEYRWVRTEAPVSQHFQLAQVNIARLLAPLDDPLLAGFVARLDDVNALADHAPGFVWRLQTDGGNATALRPYDDDRILFNLSVWQTPERLREFVYRSAHAEVMRQRKSWFVRFEGPYYALWWVPAGHIPSVDEAKGRLEHLRARGESAYAFSFAKLFPSPDSPDARPGLGFAASRPST
jgi:GNAT superfamily N-acetyltransferase